MEISVQRSKQNLGIEPAPHLHCAMSTQKIMLIVLLSLLPALGVMTFYFGFGTIFQFLIAAISALACQAFVAILRGRKIKRALQDPSGLVTAMLLALTLPPLLPWYFTLVATLFAMLIVRECFGGLGMNLFNPAMAGFIFLVISVPAVFYNTWISPAPQAISVATPQRTFEVIFKGSNPSILVEEVKHIHLDPSINKDAKHLSTATIDALSGATFLESIKTSRKAGNVDAHEIIDFKSTPYQAYAALAIAYLVGGLILIFTKVIRFQMPLSFLITVGVLGYIWHYLNPSLSITWQEHILMGGTMLGAFYIITDPVTTCGTFKGRILFSVMIGALLILIRVHGSYSDSVAFAVLLGNCMAPLMDVMTKRRPFGIGYRHGGLD